jgi:hypothetical protein
MASAAYIDKHRQNERHVALRQNERHVSLSKLSVILATLALWAGVIVSLAAIAR